MAGTLEGKVAIVTGAGRGLGQVMTLGLLEAGARVAAVEIDAPALEETENGADQRGAGERIQGIVADITRGGGRSDCNGNGSRCSTDDRSYCHGSSPNRG